MVNFEASNAGAAARAASLARCEAGALYLTSGGAVARALQVAALFVGVTGVPPVSLDASIADILALLFFKGSAA